MFKALRSRIHAHLDGHPFRTMNYTIIVFTLAVTYGGLVKAHLPFIDCNCAICRPSVFLDETPLIYDYQNYQVVIVDKNGLEVAIPAALLGNPATDTLKVLIDSPVLIAHPAEPMPYYQVAEAELLDTI